MCGRYKKNASKREAFDYLAYVKSGSLFQHVIQLVGFGRQIELVVGIASFL
jgi:hypothetical protein